jgi:hypothetical protein
LKSTLRMSAPEATPTASSNHANAFIPFTWPLSLM